MHAVIHVQAISAIPPATLRALIPVLAGIDPAKLTAQMKLLGQQDKETIDKMIYFMKSVSTYFYDCVSSCNFHLQATWLVQETQGTSRI